MSSEVEPLLEVGTAVIADVLDSFGRLPAVLDTTLSPVKGPGTKFMGPAYTVSGESQAWSGSGDRAKLDAIDAMAPGVVPVWAGNGRWRVTACQTPVRVRGALEEWVIVHPGDRVVADDDGVIVVPADSLETVLTRVTEWSRSESGARVDIRNGLPLLQALEKYGHL